MRGKSRGMYPLFSQDAPRALFPGHLSGLGKYLCTALYIPPLDSVCKHCIIKWSIQSHTVIYSHSASKWIVSCKHIVIPPGLVRLWLVPTYCGNSHWLEQLCSKFYPTWRLTSTTVLLGRVLHEHGNFNRWSFTRSTSYIHTLVQMIDLPTI